MSLLKYIPLLIVYLVFMAVIAAAMIGAFVGFQAMDFNAEHLISFFGQALPLWLTACLPVFVSCSVVTIYLVVFIVLFCDALLMYAYGLWLAQFDVPHWKGRHDRYPFESEEAADL
jgi:hypothetical protein